MPGLGVRCVSDEPWVTGGRDLRARHGARRHRAAAIRRLSCSSQIQFLRAADGSYWTGWQFENSKHYPHEHSSYTAAAVVLAADVLAAGWAPEYSGRRDLPGRCRRT